MKSNEGIKKIMSTSKEFTEYIQEQLEAVGDVRTRRMFGGALFELEGRQLGVALDNTLYFKVTDPDLQKRYKKEGAVQFSYMRKGKLIVIKNWWSVPEDAIDDRHELARLAEEVLEQDN